MKTLKSLLIRIRNNNEDGFTIIEMVITILIVSVLSGISIATYNGFRRDAIQGTLISDVRNAGVKLQGIIILSDNPGIVPENVPFFVSDENSNLEVQVIENPKGSYCVIGSNTRYEDMIIYYASEFGGITNNPAHCGIPDKQNDTPVEEVIATPEPTVEPSPVTTQTVEPTVSVSATPSPAAIPTITPTQSQTSTQTYNINTAGAPGMATYIPQEAEIIIAMDLPDATCKALIEENVRAKTNLYDRIKYYNLTSIMARLQSKNATIESILAHTPEGERYNRSLTAIKANAKCSDYINKKTTVTKYYEEVYNAEKTAYHEFLRNLQEHSAVTYAYNQSYTKLYNRVYGTTL